MEKVKVAEVGHMAIAESKSTPAGALLASAQPEAHEGGH